MEGADDESIPKEEVQYDLLDRNVTLQRQLTSPHETIDEVVLTGPDHSEILVVGVNDVRW